ncbi:MAG: energy-coupling factor transporter ATPase [Oscillospiraceae bacterium]|nr:energy-coupling factor transporter ATPase [Oscillospiraceae bacterium]
MNAVISIRGLSHVYSPKTPFECSAINDINLDIYAGETLGVIGHTGSGKSTLISHLNGLIKPSSGTILYDGEDIFKSREFTHGIRFKVGLVLQYPEYQLFEETVYEDISFGPRNMGLSKDEIDIRVHEAARFAGLSEDLLPLSPFELSGGQKRRVAIAGVIAMRPRVLILDEPTAGLDPIGREDLLAHISRYREETNAAIVIVSHSMEDIASIADRLIVMNSGSIMLSGTPSEVFSHSDELLSAGLDLPQVTHIINELKSRGLSLPGSVYTVEQAVSALLELRGEKND